MNPFNSSSNTQNVQGGAQKEDYVDKGKPSYTMNKEPPNQLTIHSHTYL